MPEIEKAESTADILLVAERQMLREWVNSLLKESTAHLIDRSDRLAAAQVLATVNLADTIAKGQQ